MVSGNWIFRLFLFLLAFCAVGFWSLLQMLEIWTIWGSRKMLSLEYISYWYYYAFLMVTLVILVGWFAETRPTKQTAPGLAVAISDGNWVFPWNKWMGTISSSVGRSMRMLLFCLEYPCLQAWVNLARESGQDFSLLWASGWHLAFHIAVISVASETGLSFHSLACLHATGESPCAAARDNAIPDWYGYGEDGEVLPISFSF